MLVSERFKEKIFKYFDFNYAAGFQHFLVILYTFSRFSNKENIFLKKQNIEFFASSMWCEGREFKKLYSASKFSGST
jgi:hypothetical protein